jgi:hypothetical protein
MKKITILLAFLTLCHFANAQSAEEIIDNYFENTGGVDAWNNITSIQMNASVNSPQAGEIPLTIYNDKDGCNFVKISIQGNEMIQVAFDGETGWRWNMMGQVAEKLEAEANENMKRAVKEFPDPFLNYKDKGFKIEKLDNETIEGTECFKIKITKEPMLVEGQEVENVAYYYFDTENFVPILQENEIKQGQAKGMTSQIFYSDYQEVGGLYFPFSLKQGAKGYPAQTINIKSIDINPEIDKSILVFPEG